MIAALFTAATASYAANCALGTAVASGVVDTREYRWVHHALYVSTLVLSGAAASSLLWSRSRAGWVLLPAAIPLSVIPSLGARLPRHPAVALAAAPFFIASLIYARR
ncbi:MAG: hypothetical protein JWM51_1178 [Microbacteriaceae bacterium]|nr:hypothetical protein [Microbacteriaceae bacterium]